MGKDVIAVDIDYIKDTLVEALKDVPFSGPRFVLVEGEKVELGKILLTLEQEKESFAKKLCENSFIVWEDNAI
jgi:hypothetical protein